MIRRPRSILALLTALNLLNYLDRFVLSAVLPRVQDEFGLLYSVSGLLGTIFLLGYFVTSPAFGTLGDRRARKGLIALGVLVWSVATITSGLSRGLGSLACSRAVVGVGEASYATLAPTIIDDIAPSDRRGRWLAVFYVASLVGSGLAYVVAGLVEKFFGWRAAFFATGGPGLLLSVLCLLIDEPPRRRVEPKAAVFHSLGTLSRTPLYRRAVLGYCAYTFAVGAFAFWAPTFLFRRYHLSLATANVTFGLITMVAGIIGTAAGGVWGDRLARREGATAPERVEGQSERAGYREPAASVERKEPIAGFLRVCAIGSAVGGPLAVVCFLAPNALAFFAAAFLCEVALFLSTSPINVVLLRSVPPEVRASAMALAIFAIHMLGDLWSPWLVGALADRMPIELAMMALPVAIGVSALVWRRGESA